MTSMALLLCRVALNSPVVAGSSERRPVPTVKQLNASVLYSARRLLGPMACAFLTIACMHALSMQPTAYHHRIQTHASSSRLHYALIFGNIICRSIYMPIYIRIYMHV